MQGLDLLGLVDYLVGFRGVEEYIGSLSGLRGPVCEGCFHQDRSGLGRFSPKPRPRRSMLTRPLSLDCGLPRRPLGREP